MLAERRGMAWQAGTSVLFPDLKLDRPDWFRDFDFLSQAVITGRQLLLKEA